MYMYIFIWIYVCVYVCRCCLSTFFILITKRKKKNMHFRLVKRAYVQWQLKLYRVHTRVHLTSKVGFIEGKKIHEPKFQKFYSRAIPGNRIYMDIYIERNEPEEQKSVEKRELVLKLTVISSSFLFYLYMHGLTSFEFFYCCTYNYTTSTATYYFNYYFFLFANLLFYFFLFLFIFLSLLWVVYHVHRLIAVSQKALRCPDNRFPSRK